MSETRAGYQAGREERGMEEYPTLTINIIQSDNGWFTITDGKIVKVFPPHAALSAVTAAFRREREKRSEAAKRGWEKRKAKAG